MNSARFFALSASAAGLLLAYTVASFSACSSSSSPPSPSGGGLGQFPVAGPDVDPPANITLQPDVVIVHGGASVLKGLSDDHGVWTLDKNASGVSNLAPGKVLLIAGLDCARVTSIQDNGSTIDVTVTPVSIGDVIQQGTVTWQDQTVDLSQGILGRVPYDDVIASGADGGAADCGAPPEGGAPDAGGDGGPICAALRGTGLHTGGGLHIQSNPSNGATLKLGNWSLTFTGTTSGSSGLDVTGSLAWQPSAAPPGPGDPAGTLGVINASISFKGHFDLSGTTGSVSLNGGSITDGNMLSQLQGSVDLNATVSTPSGSQFPAAAIIKLPVSVEFPFPIIPGLPFYLSIACAVSIQPSLATANATLGYGGHVDFSGKSGFKYSSGNATPTSAPMAMNPNNPIDTAMIGPSLGTMAIILALQAPRVSVGIGTMAFGVGAKAGVFIDVVDVYTLTAASATALVPCRGATWVFTSHGGGEMSISLPGMKGVTVTHSIDLLTPPQTGTWYTPAIMACKL